MIDETLNEKHATDPQPGDYWEDHFIEVCVVLAVVRKLVIYYDKKKQVGDNSWTCGLEKTETRTIDKFNDWLSYKSIPGYWATVHPKAHEWALKVL